MTDIWIIHRIASSEKYSSSLREIEEDWSLKDLMDANEVLDIYALEDIKASEDIKRKSNRR